MNEITHDCLCIRSMDYKENDKLITLYAFGSGKITANCRGVKKPKAKLKYASSILCFGTYYLTGRNGFYTVTGCDQIESFYGLWGDIDKYYPAISAIELLDKFSGDSEISDNLAASTLQFLKTLCYENIQNISYFFLKHLYNILTLIGYQITVSSCVKCGKTTGKRAYFSNENGGIIYECCRSYDAVYLTGAQLDILRELEDGQSCDFPKNSLNERENDTNYDQKTVEREINNVKDLDNIYTLITVSYNYVEHITEKKLIATKEYVDFLTISCK